MGFLEWLTFGPIGNFVATRLWAYPLFETLHVFGMALLVGSLGLVNLRVLGYKPELPLLGTSELLPLAWTGFTVNLVSGLLLFSSDAVYFFNSITFRVKLLLILLAGINAVLISRSVFHKAVLSGRPVAPTAVSRTVAASSLVFWIGAVLAGRLIAYLP